MSSCHFGAMCFLWVSLVVPQHSLAALSLVFPAGFQQGSLFTLPTAAQPGDAQDCHHPRALIHELLPWVRQLRAHLSTQEGFLFSSEICHLQKEILKLRVMSCLTKAEKWDWEEHVCSSLNLSAQRMQRGLGWVLKYYFKILPSDPDNSSPILAGVQCLQLWSQQQAQEPAGEPAMLFYGKSAGNPRAWDCSAAESTPCLLDRFVPKKKKKALEQNLIFVWNYTFFKQTASTLPSGFKGVRNKAGAAHSEPDLDLHYSEKRRILKLLCAWEKQDLYLRSHLWNITKAWPAKLLPWATSLSCTITDIGILGGFFPLVLLMAQSCVVSRGALCCQRAPAQICPCSQPCPGNIPWDLSWHPGLALPKCLHSTWSWSASPSAAFMQTNNSIAVEEIPHSKLYCKFF